MESLVKQVDEMLEGYNSDSQKLSEDIIADSLRKITKDIEKEDIPECVFADILAFEFSENYQEKSEGWGLYFGPKYAFINKTGEKIEFPSIKDITPEIVKFWESRTKEKLHPILLARYNSLVWEFSKVISGISPNNKFALNAIDNIVYIADKSCHLHNINVFRKLEYALMLALKIKNSEQVEKVYNVLISYEKKVAIDNKPGLWGYSLEFMDNKKIILPDKVKSQIICDMEERLERLINNTSTDFNPWAVERAAICLANYYRKTRKENEIKRVLKCLQQAFDRLCVNASPIQICSWQETIYRYFKEYGLHTEAEEVAKKLQKIGVQMAQDLKEFSYKVEIPNKEMNEFLSQFTDADLYTAYLKIAVYFTPRKTDVERELDELCRTSPLSFLINKQIIDHSGRTIATIGSIDDDKAGNIIHQMSRTLSISSIFLGAVLESIIKKFSITCEDFVNYLYKSPIFSEEKKQIFELGIKSYIEKSYIECIHILVPQIEDLIRNLIDKAGGSVLKPTRTGGFDYKNLHDLLIDDEFLSIFDEDISLYLRVLFTDPRGWNIRNNVCHGLIRVESLNRNVADRLIHVLLLLALVKEES